MGLQRCPLPFSTPPAPRAWRRSRPLRGSGGRRAGRSRRGSGRGRRHPRGAGAVAGRRRGRGHLRGTGRLGRGRALRPGAPERQRGLRLSGDRPDVSRSEELFDRAQAVLPGGVNSPVRAFRAVGGTPFFVDPARGACLTDVDGKTYLDYVCSWGPLILGHAHPAVLDAIRGAAERGWTYGAPCAAEVELAERVRRRMPALEMVRFVNSGTEATMAAVRVARAATRREVILKFEGCYHGHADGFLVKAGSGVATLGLPDSPGVPGALAELTLTVPFNDPAAVQAVFARRGQEIAAGIVAPRGGYRGRRAPARRRGDRGSRRLDVGRLSHRGAGAHVRAGEGCGHGPVCAVASRGARPGCVPRALGLRGGVRLQRAHGCRHRLHRHTTRRGPGRGAGSLASSLWPPRPARGRSPPRRPSLPA